MDKENAAQGSWNKKRIFIAVFLLVFLSVGAYYFKTKILSSQSPKSVKGASVEENKSPNANDAKIDVQKAVKDTVKEKLEDLKKEAMKIDVAEIASSSPQIQKLIKDLSSIRDYPANQAKEICEKVCGGL